MASTEEGDFLINKGYTKKKMKPEWEELAPGVFWCRGCGCIKIVKQGFRTRYQTPRRESERRKAKRK